MSAETAIVSKEKTKAEESTEHDPKAIVPGKTTPTEIVTLPLTEQETLERFNRTQHLKHRLLDPKTDMILIAGKPYIKKSGWRKLQFAFNLNDEIIREEKEEKGSKTIWRMWVRVRAPNGREVMGVASASSDEKKFSHPDHDPYALCHTRSKNRAISDILGLGEVSAEEMLSEVPGASEEVEKAESTQVPTVQPAPRISAEPEPEHPKETTEKRPPEPVGTTSQAEIPIPQPPSSSQPTEVGKPKERVAHYDKEKLLIHKITQETVGKMVISEYDDHQEFDIQSTNSLVVDLEKGPFKFLQGCLDGFKNKHPEFKSEIHVNDHNILTGIWIKTSKLSDKIIDLDIVSPTVWTFNAVMHPEKTKEPQKVK